MVSSVIYIFYIQNLKNQINSSTAQKNKYYNFSLIKSMVGRTVSRLTTDPPFLITNL